MNDKKLSCVDCGSINCDLENSKFPSFCTTTHMDEDIKKSAMEEYKDEYNKRIMISAANTEYEGYCVYTRVQETVEFAKKMNVKRIAISIYINN